MQVAANGKTFTFPDGTPPELIGEAIDEYFGAQSQVAQQTSIDQKPSITSSLGAGFVRGAEQVTGGVLQKAVQVRKSQIDSQVNNLASAMQTGAIPVTQENIDKLDSLQSEAIKLAQDLSSAESIEVGKRQEFSPYQEQRPIASTVGNIAGQMAAAPIPGMQARLPAQMIRGAIEGGGLGYIQPTVGDESSASNAGTGALIGGSAPAVLRPITNAIGGAYRSLQGAIGGDEAQAIKFAEQKGIPLTTTDIVPPQTFAGRSAQSLAEKIPVAGTGGIRAEQQLAREAQVQDIAQQYGRPSDQEIYDSLVRKSDKIANAAGKRYKEITSDMAGVAIPIDRTLSTIDAQLARLNKPGAIRNEKLTALLGNIKDDLSAGAQDINLLRENRTRFREEVKGKDAVTNDTEQRIINSVYDSMTQDMNNAVRANLGDSKAESLRQVDKIWAREATEISKTKLKNVLSKGQIKPEEASKMLFANDPSEVKTLYSSLDDAGRKNARAAVIARASDKSQGSPDAFLREMNKMRTQYNVFFRGKEGAELNGLLKYLEYTKEAGRAPLVTPTGQQAIQLGAPVAVMADVGSTGGAGTAGFAGFGLLARAYESPAVRNIIVKMNSIDKGSTAFEKLASQLEAELNKAATRTQGVEQ